MIVSWNWLKDYVDVDLDPAEVTRRLMMAGLNHEGTEVVGDDWAIDLEVTSNRPDCLGHVGVAREVAVLCQRPLRIPPALPREGKPSVAELTRVRIDCPDLCSRYTARIIRGAKIGPSPHWLAKRLSTLGVGLVNNVVDITNYVMLECGQPLHAFDFAKLAGREIVVRRAKPGETFVAIDHRAYTLEPETCVIADARSAVALGGVMGGAETEISPQTNELLIEAARFSPLSIRNTARRLDLHSPSSYRFERGVDPEGVDWASRRCCELILELAGGELASGVIDVGQEIPRRLPVVLRLSQLPRILGIEVPVENVRRILTALGNEEQEATTRTVTVIPPSWRRDLTREIDLVEEVARVYGYEKIPENSAVPMCPSHRSDQDRVLAKIRHVLTAAGFDEAVTPSLVPREWSDAFRVWTAAAPLASHTPMKGVLAEAPKDLGAADTLRQCLMSSLLEARRYNESLANPVSELFETARVYLPQDEGPPVEQWTLGVVSGQDYLSLKGLVEQLLSALKTDVTLNVAPLQHELLDREKSSELRWNGNLFGCLGELTQAALKRFGIRSATTCLEINIELLAARANLTPRHAPQSRYPSIARDLNLIVDETVLWADLAGTVRQSAGDVLDDLTYQQTYRDADKDGAGKKRLLFSVSFRSRERTLTSEEADMIRDRIVTACGQDHRARLLG